ncbi:ECF transporter S component [Faecalicatena fissicatena]|uniref:ECF transporter S component n=1 Tax=Faecalicatena fissicatena TaxID=290055 RepID=A0ABS2EAZ5_9FIRM|nr:ECF transporter S component [Faecalicatena fissicatena]MBM6738730.1 ECF transporter S component [Faecalicatena fissicatena]
MANKKKEKMDKLVLFLLPIGVAINFVGGQIAANLGLPVYLDVIGTVAVGALCGAFPGAIVGLVSNLINTVTYPLNICYAPVSIIIGILSAILSKRGFFKKPLKIALVIIVFGLIGGGLSAVITWIVYGFDFGMPPSSYISVPLYKVFHLNKFICEFIGSSCIDTFDKIISVIVVVGVLRAIPQRMLAKLPLGDNYVKEENDEEEDF